MEGERERQRWREGEKGGERREGGGGWGKGGGGGEEDPNSKHHIQTPLPKAACWEVGAGGGAVPYL